MWVPLVLLTASGVVLALLSDPVIAFLWRRWSGGCKGGDDGKFLLLFLILFPILASVWVFPLRRRDRRYRNWLIQIVPAVELAAALLLLLSGGVTLELPGMCGVGLHLPAGSLGSLLALVSAFLWAATG